MKLNRISSGCDDLTGLFLPPVLPVRVFLDVMIMTDTCPKLCLRIHVAPCAPYFLTVLVQIGHCVRKLLAYGVGMECGLSLEYSIE